MDFILILYHLGKREKIYLQNDKWGDKMINKKDEIFAGIDIGSHSLKMKVAYVDKKGEISTLENLRRTVPIGSDTFSNGIVSFDTVEELCEILKGYKRIMEDYKISTYRAVATSAVREAKNKDYIVDQIKLKTGLRIEVISNSEEKFLTYKAIREQLDDYRRLRKEGTLLVDIGAGSSELSIYKRNKLIFSQGIKIGSLRINEILSEIEKKTLDFPKILEEFIESNIESLIAIKPRVKLNNFIAIGGEISVINNILKHGKNESKYINKTDFLKLYENILYKSNNTLVKEYNVPQNRVDILLPSMILFKKFINLTQAEGMYVPLVSLRDGLISDLVDRKFNTLRNKEFNKDIISSTRNMAKRYKSDNKHIRDVEKKSLYIYDKLKKIHGLGSRERFLMQIAIILHDIGKYLSFINHHINSYNIIISSEIIGVSKEEMRVIANVAKYHSKETPSLLHNTYGILSEKNRIKVSKLAAILRLANALDRSHKQKIKIKDIYIDNRNLYIDTYSKEDYLLEQWTFINEADFFKQVFGLSPILKIKKGGLVD
ncbi:MAG: HD domain-containing protein [Firmicutes bacterium]|nr:HD domain-containing protein [Bacillota bacterium]